MKAYIHSYRTISRLDSFESGIMPAAKEKASHELNHPDYKTIIPPALIRRMGNLIKMGVAAAIKVKGEQKIEGIIVGTGLGCIENTEVFLNEFIQRPTGTLSPTAFIQSTHNTVAGQIGLILKEHCYNSTYTQRGTSFENALIDSMLLSAETNGTVLVGGLDEYIPLFENLAQEANVKLENLAAGATFFLLSQDAHNAIAKVSGVAMFTCQPNDLESRLQEFLKTENLAQPDLILYGNSFPGPEKFPLTNTTIPQVNYTNLSGAYMTNSAFATQMAAEILSTSTSYHATKILVINNFNDTDFGFIYVEKP